MTILLDLALGAAAGALTCALHLWLLWRGLMRLGPVTATVAAGRMMRGLPLRLLLWAPGCLLAARLGLFGCIGLVVGSAILRWWMAVRTLRHGPAAMMQLR